MQENRVEGRTSGTTFIEGMEEGREGWEGAAVVGGIALSHRTV